jgi:hypothetical protein
MTSQSAWRTALICRRACNKTACEHADSFISHTTQNKQHNDSLTSLACVAD